MSTVGKPVKNVGSDNGRQILSQKLCDLKSFLPDFLSIIFRILERDCDILRNPLDHNLKFDQIKKKYCKLVSNLIKVISSFDRSETVTKDFEEFEEYLHNWKLTVNRVKDVSLENLSGFPTKIKCCSREGPHIHESVDGSPIVIQLKKGTVSEMDFVKKLVSQMEHMSLEEKKIVFKQKLCQRRRSKRMEQKENLLKVEGPSEQIQDIAEHEFSSPHTNRKGIQLAVSERCPSVSSIPENSSSLDEEPQPSVSGITHEKRITEDRKEVVPLRKITQHESSDNRIEPLLIYDSLGNPLTDSNGIPLINMKGHMVIRYEDDKPISHINGEPIFDKSGLPFISSFDEPLRDSSGNPLRLFNEDNIPLTDEKGFVMQLNNGCYSIVLDQFNRIFSDAHGSAVYDIEGKPLSNDILSQYKSISNSNLLGESIHPILYNEKGFLLTDSTGKSLINSKGEPLIKMDISTGTVTDNNGNPVFDSEGNIYGAKLNKPKLTVFNCEKYPLTNSKGQVLHDATGKPMVKFDQTGKPVLDLLKRVIFDENGIPSTKSDFKPYSDRPPKHKKVICQQDEQLYDRQGYPLLDFDGSSLLTLDGQYLVRTRNGTIVHDLNGNPIFDSFGIPVTRIDGCWLCPQGDPYRVFDTDGKPLTNKHGHELLKISGKSLIAVDSLGRPVNSITGSPVCDSKGVPATDPSFDPSQLPPNNELKMQVYFNNAPLKVFDRFGKPLTDSNGMALFDRNGRCLLQFNEAGVPTTDINGQTIFDKKSVPLNCSPTQSILTMSGEPYRLFNREMYPLTNKNGIPLKNASKKCLIKFDAVGRPCSDINGSPLLDVGGRDILNDLCCKPEEAPDDIEQCIKGPNGKPLLLFDKDGNPLTDFNGAILVNADGTHMMIDHNGVPTMDSKGGPIYDINKTPVQELFLGKKFVSEDFTSSSSSKALREIDPFGRPLKDPEGIKQFDIYGRPKFDLYRHPIYNSKGQPISNAFGRRLSDNKQERTFGLSFDPTILSGPLHLSQQGRSAHLKDLIGGPLFDENGLPLINQFGKPLIDIYGLSLYDDHGFPKCDNEGRPISDHIRRCHGIVKHVKDIESIIHVPDAVKYTIDHQLGSGKRVYQSPLLHGSWIMSSIDSSLNLKKENIYWAVVRITTFEDHSKMYELLRAAHITDLSKEEFSSDLYQDEDDEVQQIQQECKPSHISVSTGKTKQIWMGRMGEDKRYAKTTQFGLLLSEEEESSENIVPLKWSCRRLETEDCLDIQNSKNILPKYRVVNNEAGHEFQRAHCSCNLPIESKFSPTRRKCKFTANHDSSMSGASDTEEKIKANQAKLWAKKSIDKKKNFK